jgi:hypothetical protein
MNKFKYFIRLFGLILTLYTEGVFAQNITNNNGAKLVIGSGGFVVVSGNVSNSGTNTALTNNGTLITEGTLQNASTATISGNGSYKVSGNWDNAATFTAGTSTVELTGNTTATTVNSGNSSFYNLTLNKGATYPIVNLLTNSARVTNTLNFTGASNEIQLGALNLTVGLPIVGTAATKYVISDGVGRLIASTVNSTPFLFPIGSSSTSYTPLSISQSGTALSLGVRVQNQVLDNGTTGTALSAVVNKSWVVTEEGTPISKNLTFTPQWNGTDQLSGFDIAKCGVSRWNPTTSSWDLTTAAVGARSGTDPYTRTRSSISQVGTFAVGGKNLATYVLLSAKVFLQGAYSGSSLMRDNLREANRIPSGENASLGGGTPRPVGFTHVGFGGGEVPSGISTFDVQPNTNDNIVDWVFIELRSIGGTGATTVLHTRAALLQRDGDVVNEDGTSPLKLYGVADGNYHIAIRHRNHLGARTATTKALSKSTTTVVDFTSVLSEALATVPSAGYNALATMSDGKFALWGGNINGDGLVKRISTNATGGDNDLTYLTAGLSTNLVVKNVYQRADVNLDSNVRRTGSASTNDYTKLLGYMGANTVIAQPTF